MNWFNLQSNAIHDAIYNMNWIHAPSSLKKCLLIIMIRSAKPQVVTASKFSIVTLKSFSNVCKL